MKTRYCRFSQGPNAITLDGAAVKPGVRPLLVVAAICVSLPSVWAQAPGTITTVAGNGTGTFPGDGGLATRAGIGGGGQSLTIATGSAGNLYIADQANNRIRRVNSAGIISTFAGGGAGPGLGDGGPATSAQVFPNGIAVDSNRNVYIASGAQVRKVSSNGVITTIAGTGLLGNSGDGGPAIGAQFMATGVAVDAAGNLYITDSLANRVRKINPAGTISAFARHRDDAGQCRCRWRRQSFLCRHGHQSSSAHLAGRPRLYRRRDRSARLYGRWRSGHECHAFLTAIVGPG
ncbi:MAG: SBBP repeat-containing protein [Acidobacteria bacterium]|nr:SBBP repeat-containing protein [Acidobacteriota bacterium]